jgi:ribokinase
MSDRDLRVVVLGEAAVDWVVEVEALPGRDSLALARSCRRFPGGSAANVAVGLARLGYRVAFVGQLGDDENGAFLREMFREAGVDTSGIVEIPGYETPACWVVVDGRGDHLIVALPRDVAGYRSVKLDLDRLLAAQGIYIGASHTEVAYGYAAAAKSSAIPVFYAPGGSSRQLRRANLEPIMACTEVLFVSRAEAAALAGLPMPEEAADQLLDTGPRVVVETAGAEGAFVATHGRTWQVPAFPVTGRRDTTGAGDAFAAGFVAAFLRGFNLVAAARVGSAAAALKISHLGARSGLPTWEEVLSKVTRNRLAV